jgi:uncharacterized membrane protein (UPF0127 family)
MRKNAKVNVSINNYTLMTDLSITDEQIIKGLSIKDSLKENEGMLFILNPSSRRGFWMKDMKFPIDVIWLNENKEIVHIKKSLEPCVSNCPVYYPDRESKYVLETVAGFANKQNLRVGDKVFFELQKDLVNMRHTEI